MLDDLEKLINDNNQRPGLSGTTVLYIALTESGGDPNANASSSSAIGLMQITKVMAKQAKCSYSALADPAEAIQCATKYMCWLSKNFSPNMFSVIGMYNQGPGSGGMGSAADKYKKKIDDCSLCIMKSGCCDDCNPNKKK
ncbi:MAG: hypothetical protein DMF56_12750 [Acidobacteria bacterium]|nr:MAG: hypothetical protein DMF56_12750 [Acidobacteriota bacterium]